MDLFFYSLKAVNALPNGFDGLTLQYREILII